jgi:hypothetical protein
MPGRWRKRETFYLQQVKATVPFVAPLPIDIEGAFYLLQVKSFEAYDESLVSFSNPEPRALRST